MSDPLSAVEIEDVLSSIRRLVSEDLRPVQRQVPVAGDKLILTPALRVVPEVRIAPFVLAPDAAAPEAPMVVNPQDISSQTIMADAAVPVADQLDEWDAEGGAPETAAPWSEAVWDSAVTPPEPEFAVAADIVDAVIVDVQPLSAEAEAEADAAIGWGQDDAVEEVFVEADPEIPVVHADADWVAEAEAQVIASLSDADPGLFPLEDEIAGDGDAIIEEQVLRDLVRDLIREELQGGLGERITRNIRKLVRAEIARALALRDFD